MAKLIRVHFLKCKPEYFNDLTSGSKPFDLRPDDRDYRVGDYLAVRPFEPRKPDAHFERVTYLKVTYVMRRDDSVGKQALRPGWCVLGVDKDVEYSVHEVIESEVTVKIIGPRA